MWKKLFGKEEIVIDPLLMIEGALIIANNSDVTKQDVFEHELSVSLPAIFDLDGKIRLADDKSNLPDYIAQNNSTINITRR